MRPCPIWREIGADALAAFQCAAGIARLCVSCEEIGRIVPEAQLSIVRESMLHSLHRAHSFDAPHLSLKALRDAACEAALSAAAGGHERAHGAAGEQS